MSMNIRVNDGQGEPLDPNDDARPDAGGAPPSPAAAAGQGGEQQAAPPMDSDDAELLAAREALAAEQAALAAGTLPAAAAAAPSAPTTGTPAAAPPATEGANQPPPMVPVHVAVAERKARQQAEREADFLRGQVEALRNTLPPAATTTTDTPAPAAPADPIQAAIDAENAKILALAEKADMGEITFKELEQGRIAAQQTIMALSAQRVAPAPQESLADQAIVTAHTNSLYAKHPYAAVLTDQQAQFLAGIAAQELAATGQPVTAGAAGDMRLREAVAALSDFYGPRWGLKPATPAPGSVQQQQNPNPAQPGGLSDKARAAMAKMDLAAGLPPDTRAMGTASQGTDLSSAAIEAMDEEQIAALPAATRHRLLGFASG
jgi:hypothetical protein